MAEEKNRNIYDMLEEEIMNSELSLKEKNKRLSRLIRMRGKKVNIIFVGATGSGKSSTINALFNMEVAKVGVGVDPETADIKSYVLDNLTIWDTPGLGEGAQADERYNRMITKKLSELDEDGKPLIDLVLVVLDASSKDLGTSYDLINNVLIPCLGEDKEGRILIALNQADVAMKGKHWNADRNEPDEELLKFLQAKADSVSKRIHEATGVKVRPVYYCAGYKEEGGVQCKPYNLSRLLYYIVRSVPAEKRLVFADKLNQDASLWGHGEFLREDGENIQRSFWEIVCDGAEDGADTGADIGETGLGIPGMIAGYVIGGVLGTVGGLFEATWGLVAGE
ncbi:MAG: 50S ribosome-binding GTPase [Lachnospiraceae bacterium]|nr:50S ribosome-binding GTPase [Lachnospiraceae bacterium]